jgi:hypothetical protein
MIKQLRYVVDTMDLLDDSILWGGALLLQRAELHLALNVAPWMYLCAVMVAMKVLEDDAVSLADFALLGKCTSAELAHLERLLVFKLEFNCSLSWEELHATHT